MTDPYARKLVNGDFYHAKVDIKMKIVAVLDGKLDNRGLELIQPISRTFSKNTIIELIATDDANASPGNKVDNIAYLAFAELQNGGVLLEGDTVLWKNNPLGVIAGYDDTHMPNHQNTIIRVNTRISGKELGFQLGDEIVVRGFNK